MKNTIKMLTNLVLAFVWPLADLQAQKVEKPDEKYSPYELMSSYYDEGFKPFKKGNIFVGFSFSLEDKKLTNTDYLFDHVIAGDRLKYNIILKGGYYTGNYGMAGIKFNYSKDKFQGEVLSSEGLIFVRTDTVQSSSTTSGFGVSPFFRSSIPVTPTERLSFFVELGFTLGGSNTNATKTKSILQVEKTKIENFHFNVGLSPGITFFAMENFALEAQLDLLGYNLDISKKTIDNSPEAKQTRQNVDFSIDILSLNLGLAYYIGANRK